MALNFKNISCVEVPNKEDHYDIKIETYKESIEGRFERSQIRHLIEVLDNSINVGLPDNEELKLNLQDKK